MSDPAKPSNAPRSLATYLTFCLQVRALQERRRFSVVSWWRSAQRNASVGGLVNSRHLDGTGADLLPDPDEDHAGLIEDARALGLQIDARGPSIHIELDPL